MDLEETQSRKMWLLFYLGIWPNPQLIMRILLIEDEKKIASFIKRGLKEEHYTVDVTYEGEKGLFLAGTSRYDLIILDIMLPG